MFSSRHQTPTQQNHEFEKTLDRLIAANYVNPPVKVSVTVLVRPGPPVISPRTPVATEGETMNLTCSSEGGSPAPDIFWYTEDSADPLHGAVNVTDRLTVSTLQIVPKKVYDNQCFKSAIQFC